MTPPSDSSRTSTVRIEFWYLLSPCTIRPVWPPEMPKTISIPASSSTRATNALASISSVSIGSIVIASSSLGPAGVTGAQLACSIARTQRASPLAGTGPAKGERSHTRLGQGGLRSRNEAEAVESARQLGEAVEERVGGK